MTKAEEQQRAAREAPEAAGDRRPIVVSFKDTDSYNTIFMIIDVPGLLIALDDVPQTQNQMMGAGALQAFQDRPPSVTRPTNIPQRLRMWLV